MFEMDLSYDSFKSIVTAKNLLWQFNDTGYSYDIFAIDGTIKYNTSIRTDFTNTNGFNQTQETNNKTDFDTNYKDSANKPLEYRSTDGLLKMASAKFVEALNLYVDGENGHATVSAGATAYLRTHYSSAYTLAGVDAQWSTAPVGSYLDFEVGLYTDEQDENTFVSLNKFGNQYKILGTGSRLFDVPTVKVVPTTVEIAPGVNANVYIRTKVVNAGLVPMDVAINLVGWK